MKLTKLEHACLILEESGDTLVIDPGGFTRPVTGLRGVVAIVITHEHQDHWTLAQIEGILAENPGAQIYGPEGVATATAAATAAAVTIEPTTTPSGFAVIAVAAGDNVSVGSFRLQFFGGVHSEIHSSIALIDNVGVLVNETFYYAGDSFSAPTDVVVEILAVPIGAPWLKLSESMDYVSAIGPNRTFPVHEMVLSAAGQAISNARIAAVTEQLGGTFHPLQPGESLQL